MGDVEAVCLSSVDHVAIAETMGHVSSSVSVRVVQGRVNHRCTLAAVDKGHSIVSALHAWEHVLSSNLCLIRPRAVNPHRWLVFLLAVDGDAVEG